jgi:hypothetical protein
MTTKEVLLNRKRVNEWQKRNPEKYSFQLWRSSLKRKYNLTVEEYDEMLKSQNGVCAICFQPEKSMYKDKPFRLAVDHCHKTFKVRALLCRDCNQTLGKFNEDITRFQNVIDYLMKHKEGN